MPSRTAIVTGGLAGIGLAITRKLAEDGFRVAAGSRRGDEPAVSARARNAVGAAGYIGQLDVCDNDSIRAFVDTVQDKLGTPQILVNCAGVSVHQTVDGHSDDDWTFVLETNLTGPFRMTRACLPAMKASGFGRIVNIASTAARVAEPTHAAYCASKAGLVALTNAVAREGAPHGVSCVSVSPGWVETEMLHESAAIMAAASGRTAEEEIRAIAASNPQKRLIQPEEVAAVVAFCCSDAADGLTMEDIQVNAGALW